MKGVCSMLSITLRVLLILFSTGTLVFTLLRIRNAKVQISAAIFWILLTFILVIVSVFPGIIIYIADWLGVDSTANFVFLCAIFVLLIKVFFLSLHISKQQYQIQQLAQLLALEAEEKKQTKETQSGNIANE